MSDIPLARVQQKRDAQGEPETLQWFVHDLIRAENQIEGPNKHRNEKNAVRSAS